MQSSTTTTSGKTGSAGSAPGLISQGESSADVKHANPKPPRWVSVPSVSFALQFEGKQFATTEKYARVVVSRLLNLRRLASERRRPGESALSLTTGGEI